MFGQASSRRPPNTSSAQCVPFSFAANGMEQPFMRRQNVDWLR
jgi:hypothetical protein